MNQWVSTLMFLVVVGAPAISWLIQKLKAQHEIKQERDRVRAAEEQALRTGQIAERRPAPEPTTPTGRSQQQLQDLAARRKAQLEALRARQQQQQQGGAAIPTAEADHAMHREARAANVTPEELAREREAEARRAERARAFLAGTSAPPAPGVPTPTRVPQRPGMQPQPSRRPPGVASRQQQQVASGQQRRRPPQQVSPSQRRAQESPGRAPQPAPTRRVQRERSRAPGSAIAASEGRVVPLARGQHGAGRSTGGVRSLFVDSTGRPRSKEDLRRIIAATEVLGPPVSMRSGDPGEDR